MLKHLFALPGDSTDHRRLGLLHGNPVREGRTTTRLPALAVFLVLTLPPADATAQVVTTLAGSGSYGYADGTGADASFRFPWGVSVDRGGNLYVADLGNRRIRRITPGGVVTTLAGSGTQGSVDGAGIAASFDNPHSVAVNGSGDVYVADANNNAIRKVTSAGVVTTLAGQAGYPASIDGTGSAARFFSPQGVAVDGAGNVFVADSLNHKIRKVTPGGEVTTIAGSGALGYADGPGYLASFNVPQGVAVDGSGQVYVADTENHKIRKITPDGVVTTLAGSGLYGYADGPATTAEFNYPIGLAADDGGNVYVADSMNNRIRKISPAGMVTTFAGSGVYGNNDGPVDTASFGNPRGVAVDGSCNVYVADSGNQNIRKIAPSGRSCALDVFTTYLSQGRYRVTSHWQNQYAGGQLSPLFATRLTDTTAAFWLSDSSTYEYLIRINTATDNGRAWIAIPTFTDVEFWVAVTDTTTGQYFEYHSPPGNKTLIYDPLFFVYP